MRVQPSSDVVSYEGPPGQYAIERGLASQDQRDLDSLRTQMTLLHQKTRDLKSSFKDTKKMMESMRKEGKIARMHMDDSLYRMQEEMKGMMRSLYGLVEDRIDGHDRHHQPRQQQ